MCRTQHRLRGTSPAKHFLHRRSLYLSLSSSASVASSHFVQTYRRNNLVDSPWVSVSLSLLVCTIVLVNWELARANFLSCVSRPHLRSLRVSRRLNPKMVEELSREEQEMGRVDSDLS